MLELCNFLQSIQMYNHIDLENYNLRLYNHKNQRWNFRLFLPNNFKF